jgi:hypothetical protein
MDLPGEKLIIRMWETLSEKGIGAIFRPSQTRREGIANIEVRRAEMLVLAQAEHEVKEIQSGNKSLADFSLKIEFAGKNNRSDVVSRVEPTLDFEFLVNDSNKRKAADSLRKEINVVKAIIHAEEFVLNDSQEPPKEKVDEDWLFRWRDYAGDVSSNDMQGLWGRLLAGEVKAPGKYSLRCLEFLRNLSQSEAKLIERLSCLLVEGLVWKGDRTNELLSFDELLELENLGVLSGVSTGGLQNNTSLQKSNDRWVRIIRASKKCLIVRHVDKNEKISLLGYRATKLGEQIISVGRLSDDVKYLNEMGRFLISKGFSVLLGDYVESGDATNFSNATQIV